MSTFSSYIDKHRFFLVRDIVLNDTFNVSPISCWSVLFVDKTGVHEESPMHKNRSDTELLTIINYSP
jgi:hypothetical protein